MSIKINQLVGFSVERVASLDEAEQLMKNSQPFCDLFLCDSKSELLTYKLISPEDPMPGTTAIVCRSALIYRLIQDIFGYGVQGKGIIKLATMEDNTDARIWVVVVSDSLEKVERVLEQEIKVMALNNA